MRCRSSLPIIEAVDFHGAGDSKLRRPRTIVLISRSAEGGRPTRKKSRLDAGACSQFASDRRQLAAENRRQSNHHLNQRLNTITTPVPFFPGSDFNHISTMFRPTASLSGGLLWYANIESQALPVLSTLIQSTTGKSPGGSPRCKRPASEND